MNRDAYGRPIDLLMIREELNRFKYYTKFKHVFENSKIDVCGLLELIENLINTEEEGNFAMARALMENNK